ncbi:MAG: HlyD family secretion protein [Gemmatimonadaceae bacterium]
MASVLTQTTEGPLTAGDRAPATPANGRGRRIIVITLVAAVVLVTLLWGVKTWLYGRGHESTDNAQVDGHLIPVLAKVGGYVIAVNAAENAAVRENAVLVVIDSSEYVVRYQQAEADLQAARAAAGSRGIVGQAQAMVASASDQRSVAGAQITAARANQEKALADLARYRELAAKQIVSKQQLDAAQAAADAATATLTATLRQEEAAGAGVVNAQAGVRLAQARLAAAQAARDNAALQLSYTRITAPTTGIVAKKQVEVGQLVQSGQPLLTLVSDTGVWITANFKETQLGDLRIGQSVVIDVDAYGRAAKGVVESISPASGAKFALLPPDNATGNFTRVVQRVPVRVRITEGVGADRPLRPGMSVTVHVIKRGARS